MSDPDPGRSDLGIERHVETLYARLRSVAQGYLRTERASHTLQPTALVHEAWLRLARQTRRLRLERAQFLAAAAGAMRLVLVDHARRHSALRRQGPARPDRSTIAEPGSSGRQESCALDVLAVHIAIEELARVDAPLARLVELRFFGGLNDDECARLLGQSSRTIRRHWRVARLWLARALEADIAGGR